VIDGQTAGTNSTTECKVTRLRCRMPKKGTCIPLAVSDWMGGNGQVDVSCMRVKASGKMSSCCAGRACVRACTCMHCREKMVRWCWCWLVGHVLTANKKERSKVKRDCALGRIEDPRVN
jgi:hypothetical protein